MMERTLSIYNVETGETSDVIDVTEKTRYEIFALKFELLSKIEAPFVLLDSDEPSIH